MVREDKKIAFTYKGSSQIFFASVSAPAWKILKKSSCRRRDAQYGVKEEGSQAWIWIPSHPEEVLSNAG